LGKVGAPFGNNNPGKNKPWADAVRAALTKFERDEDWVQKARDKPIPAVKRGTALDVIAERLVAQAVCGDQDAMAEIANRLDGKPRQEMELSGHVAMSALSDDDLRKEIRDTISEMTDDGSDLV
jgi:hypothetical protein